MHLLPAKALMAMVVLESGQKWGSRRAEAVLNPETGMQEPPGCLSPSWSGESSARISKQPL